MNELVTLLTIGSNALLGWIVWRKNSRSATNRLFVALSGLLIIWSLTNYISLTVTDPHQALFWIRAVMVTVAGMFPVILLLADTFPNRALQRSWKTIACWTVGVLAMQLLAVSPGVFSGVDVLDNRVTPIPGPFIPVYGVYVLFHLLTTIVVLVRRMKMARGRIRAQIRIMLWGLAVTFSVSFVTTFVLVTWLGITSLVILGPSYSLFLIGAVAYAVVKHRFLDISYFVGRTISFFVLLLATLVLSDIVLYVFGGQKLFANRWTAVGALVAAALIFHPIRILLEKITDRFLFKGTYDPNILFSQLTTIMALRIDIDQLCDELLENLMGGMRLSASAIILESNGGSIVKSKGFMQELDSNDEVLKKLLQSKSQVFFAVDELREQETRDFFSENRIELIVLLKVGGVNVGALLLGEKSSGDVLNKRDFFFLRIFADQAAVALHNALSHKEIKMFNETLERRVEERTAQLKQSQARELEEAKALLKMKDDFSQVIYHDLKSPVTAIRGYMELIEQSGKKLTGKAGEYFSGMRDANERLSQLVKDLLHIAQSESDEVRLKSEKVNLNSILHMVAKQFQLEIEKKKISLLIGLDKNHYCAYGDEEKWMAVFENLLSNAIKYNKEGGSIVVLGRVEKSQLIVSVRDTGIGIPLTEQKFLFRKFHRIHLDGVEKTSGSGLGLYVVRMLLEQMNSQVVCKSSLGKGSEFRVVTECACEKHQKINTLAAGTHQGSV